MKNKKGFTLLELLMALIIAGMLVSIALSIYTSFQGADIKMSNKRLLVAESNDLIDKIHEAALYYTIDYEEYFNRRGLNLGIGSTGFSTYGNDGQRYYCGSGWDRPNNDKYSVYMWKIGYGCFSGGNQKYGEYQFQHRSLVTGDLNNKLNSGSNMKIGPIAIEPNTGLDYLYLISPEGDERYYFRRVLKENHGDGKNDKLYTIQMLKLKGFDAGKKHNFDSRGAYDGFIDTRACDYSQGFICNGESVADNYRTPIDYNDGWVDITTNRVTVNDFRVDIYPPKDPYLAGNETGYVQDPYIKLSFTMNVYGKRVEDEITLSTTFSLKNSYTRFPITQYTGYIPEDVTGDTI